MLHERNCQKQGFQRKLSIAINAAEAEARSLAELMMRTATSKETPRGLHWWRGDSGDESFVESKCLQAVSTAKGLLKLFDGSDPLMAGLLFPEVEPVKNDVYQLVSELEGLLLVVPVDARHAIISAYCAANDLRPVLRHLISEAPSEGVKALKDKYDIFASEVHPILRSAAGHAKRVRMVRLRAAAFALVEQGKVGAAEAEEVPRRD